MRTIFHPFLPNGPTGDPLLWVDLPDEGHSVLLDLGDLHLVPVRKVLRVDRVVVTHTHMDHFIGFDQLLRVALGRERELAITGPAGFVEQVERRIAGYTWNLIESYPIRLVAEEVDGDRLRAAAFTGASRMRPVPLPDRPFTGPLHATRAYTIRAATFDHGVPVLGVLLAETEHLSVNKDRLDRLGLEPGPWLSELKNWVRRAECGDAAIEARTAGGGIRNVGRQEIAAEILLRTRGQRIAYLTDLRGTSENLARAAELARGVDVLVCEAAFLDADADLARERCHLTARQAGELARAAGAQRLVPVHFSPRYQGREAELVAEAHEAFGGPVLSWGAFPDRVFGDG